MLNFQYTMFNIRYYALENMLFGNLMKMKNWILIFYWNQKIKLKFLAIIRTKSRSF